MKKLNLLLLLLLILVASPCVAKKSNLKYDFYGFVRGDFFFNSRASVAPNNELFYLYPLPQEFDPSGEDLNALPSSGFFSFITRMGLDVTGQKIGSATAEAKIEVDFGGFSSSYTMLRIRQAYVKLKWESKHSLLFGQTWHPLFGTVAPSISNLSTGAPFQPFNRSPQIRYEFNRNSWRLTVASLWQLQYLSSGPKGTNVEYTLKSCIPEFYTGVDYSKHRWQIGGGVNILSLKPRTESIVNELTYKVNERMTAISGEVHLKYSSDKLNIGVKSVLASALDHTLMLGGYGVTSVAGTNMEQQYTALQNSSTWLNISYGKRWKPNLFIGYTKNLGSSKSLVSADKIYGRGLDIDQLLGVNLGMSYNTPAWTFGLEYSTSTAWYGDINLNTGRVINTNDVTNNRIAAIAVFNF